ncbi:hypothetical protein [Agrococcus jenensis]|uniref:Uncharacterized protein n=1 Tax=Agrococcus jenensis TaxID=46353 RepID=A0A3N2AV52_9MICO|nr:hypothetical protein [Agrococcus jenensis]ROR66913.1 hypothetical protein EDD26_2308 [Agrococcus jenensis]
MDAAPKPYRAIKAVLFAFGTIALASGATAVFVSSNDAGSAALVVVGAALLAFGVLLERIVSLRAGPVELQLELVRTQAEIAAAVERGDSDRAARLSERATALVASLSPLAAEYERVRSLRPGSREHPQALDERAVEAARRRAAADDVAPETIELLFDTPGAGNRLTALALIQGRPEAASLPVLERAILHAASDVEQLQALRSAEAAVGSAALDPARRAQLIATVDEAVRIGRIRGDDSDRMRIAKRIAGLA